MTMDTDISGQTLYLPDMADIVISSTDESEKDFPVKFLLSDSGGNVILEEYYFFDFDGIISIGLKDVLSEYFSHVLPDIGESTAQPGLFAEMSVEVNDGELSASFTVNGMSRLARERSSDIDVLRIPDDFILPLSIHDVANRAAVEFVTPYSRHLQPSWLPTAGTGKGSMTGLLDMSGYPSWLKESFHVEFPGTEPLVSSPQFRLCGHHFEQYLFANRYGGFDNIPMDGLLAVEYATEHESGIYSGKTRQIRSRCIGEYTQNSGYMSRKTIEAMAELICSHQIWHWKDGVFRQIVILESDISSASDSTLHNFSFKYKYADKLQ